MQEIILTQSQVTVIDDDELQLISMFSWYAQYDHRSDRFYAMTKDKLVYGPVGMQSLIMFAAPMLRVDHRNGNTLDNRKSNLRVCTHSQNAMNAQPRTDGTSKYKGVYRETPKTLGHKKLWIAQITISYKQKRIGAFYTEEEAALAYNIEAKKLHGEFAVLNKVM